MTTPMTDNTKLPVRALELLISRICHDLVSPVGAINNGIEFIKEMGEDALDDSIQLIDHSAHQASVRLQLFRICYGGSGNEHLMSAKMIYEAFMNFIDKDKFSFEWDLMNDVPDELPDGFFKMILNSLIFIHDGLPKGGKIVVKLQGHVMSVSGTGDMIRLREGTQDALNGKVGVDALDAKNIHGYITHFFGENFGIEQEFTQNDDGLEIRLFIA